MAHYFGALIRDLRDSYELRVGEPLTVAQLSIRTGYSPSMLGAIERGESLPESGLRVQSIDDALHADGQLKTLWPVVQRLGHCPIDDLASTTNRATESYRENGSSTLLHGDDMERRHLFQLATLGLLAQAPIFGAGEPIRQLLEQSLQTSEGHTIDDWEAVCAHHLYAVNNQPPAKVRDDLLVDLLAVQRSLANATPAQAGELHRITAWLSCLQGNLLTRLGEYGAARRWWTTARHAADASPDRDMQVWVRGSEAVFGLYTPRATESILLLSRKAQQLAGERVTPGLIGAVCAEAQALAVSGHREKALERLNRLHELAGRSVNRQEFGWNPGSMWFTTSWVHSFSGTSEAAREARDRAASSMGYQDQANVRLHEAIHLSNEGGHNEGLQLAAQVIATLEPTYLTHMILHTARMVLDTVPIEKRADLPALGDYRSALDAPVPN
ncbi:helix-turn-helix domain-containing protein [Sphaerisporangium siamense]|uniref:Transcriptional regulator with XRE-family HTH domain n=1 Tax=Sphaerisporangium siamense TaxID=795645 RepID=A0A7W7GBL2_9ACTN|nr:helix-turn-helix transcriptional regulator [Sphaerisporangium siamense]MBB4705173.1 transcriptional regulator with XRE-family HTH domain [Sphaerisporangium siamense]